MKKIMLTCTLILFCSCISLCFGQSANARWGGRIIAFNYAGQANRSLVFQYTIQNTGGGVERYRANVYIVANNPTAQRQSFVLSTLMDKIAIGSLLPSRVMQCPLYVPNFTRQPNYSYTLVLELVEYGWPFWVIDKWEYHL